MIIRITSRTWLTAVTIAWFVTVGLAVARSPSSAMRKSSQSHARKQTFQDPVVNATEKVKHGQQVFRFDTFGDQALGRHAEIASSDRGRCARRCG